MKRIRPEIALTLLALLLAAASIVTHASARPTTTHPAQTHTSGYSNRRFWIWRDQFLKDGRPFRFISGSIHYSRIPVEYWRDRLERLAGLGLNSIQFYVPWNWHEQVPQQYDFSGWRNVTAFLDLAHEMGFLVLLRPGPYICGEWEFGGFPAWLISDEALTNATSALRATASATAIFQAVAHAKAATATHKTLEALSSSGAASGRVQQLLQRSGLAAAAAAAGKEEEKDAMVLRSSDPRYLYYVDRWWDKLLPMFKSYLYTNGGPIVMVQVENEYGYYGEDKVYLRHLVAKVRQHYGDDVLLFTTDGTNEACVRRGTLEGPDVLTVVDFGPSQDLQRAFALQRPFNPPGMSPPFCSEFYTGWLTHWGEAMANTSAEGMAAGLQSLLAWAGGTASVNLYMAHGGTNFGFWAGANAIAINSHTYAYQPHITSYDYDSPIGEAGTTGQLGIGGADKYEATRKVILAATAKHPHAATASRKLAAAAAAKEEPAVPADPNLAAYGSIQLTQSADLLQNLEVLVSEGLAKGSEKWPLPMEQYGQAFGLILYSTELQCSSNGCQGLQQQQQQQQQQRGWAATQYVSFAANDYAKVLLGDEVIGSYWRNDPLPIPLPQQQHQQQQSPKLQILVEGMGRNNFAFSSTTYVDPKGLVSNVTLDDVVLANWAVQPIELDYSSVAKLDWQQPVASSSSFSSSSSSSSNALRPTFYRGSFTTAPPPSSSSSSNLPADTFLLMDGWDKGYVWVNGHNLGRYWQSQGPQRTLYVPGCWLHSDRDNEVVVLELSKQPAGTLKIDSVAEPSFSRAV